MEIKCVYSRSERSLTELNILHQTVRDEYLNCEPSHPLKVDQFIVGLVLYMRFIDSKKSIENRLLHPLYAVIFHVLTS